MEEHRVHFEDDDGQEAAVCACGNREAGATRAEALRKLPCRQPRRPAVGQV